jgi:cold shock protein
MASGTVKWFDPNRGYGFIRPEQGEDVFVHISAVQASGLQTLQEGQAVEFDIEQGRKGPQAVNVRVRLGRVGMTRRSCLPPG